VTGSVGRALYKDARYYFHFYVSANSDVMKDPVYFQPLTSLPLKKHDPNIYFYNIFTKKVYKRGSIYREPEVEILGYYNPDTKDDSKKGNIVINKQLNTIFFHNSSSKDAFVSLKYASKELEFTIEAYSYAQLTIPTPEEEKNADPSQPSQPMFSLRPNILHFYEVQHSGKDRKYKNFTSFNLPGDDVAGYPCNIEIYEQESHELAICLQGFMSGNYDQPVTQRVRDVTPCPCVFWYQSTEQLPGSEGYSNLPGQVWMVYQGQDSQIIEKVGCGQTISFDLVRPLIEQSDTYLYCLYVVTHDDAQALQFIRNFIDKKTGLNVYANYSAAVNKKIVESFQSQTESQISLTKQSSAIQDSETLSLQDQLAILQGPVDGNYAVIEDVNLGMVGYCLGADVFTPKGLGFGRFYYSLAPSIIDTSALVPFLLSLLDQDACKNLAQTDEQLQEILGQKVNQWVKNYIDDKKLVTEQVTNFIISYGKSMLFDENKMLSDFGQSRVQNFMTGNVSIQFPPMKLSVMTNYYVYDFGKSKPKNMPEAGKMITLVSPIAKKK
jgi:hypothetical protein